MPSCSVTVWARERHEEAGARCLHALRVCELLQKVRMIRPFIPGHRVPDGPSNLLEVIHDLAGTIRKFTAPMLAIHIPCCCEACASEAAKRLCGVIINNLIKLTMSEDEVKIIETLIEPAQKHMKARPRARCAQIQRKLATVAR